MPYVSFKSSYSCVSQRVPQNRLGFVTVILFGHFVFSPCSYLTVAVAFLIDLICKCCQTNHISPPTTTLSIGNLTLRDWLHIIMLVIGYIDP